MIRHAELVSASHHIYKL